MGQRSEELLEQARKSAPLAARRGNESLLLAKAQGCRVFDADNVAYIDLVGGGGANLLGYGNQYVLDAVRRASTMGLTTGFHAVAELEVVEQLETLLPGLSPWVLTTSETTAWELALRWCRSTTGRERIIVFDANRRGGVEPFFVEPAGPMGISQPLLEGVPAEVSRLVRVLPWGDAATFVKVIAEVGVDTAAVVLDPIGSGAGVLPPSPSFLTTVQEHARRVGAKFVLDETLTGFRLARGGAAEVFGLTPDVAVFGGALGGGVAPVGAVAWQRTEGAVVDAEIAPPPAPFAMLAAGASLSVLRNDSVFQRLEERAVQLQTGVEALAERFLRPLRFMRVGSVFACAFSKQPLGEADTVVDRETWMRFYRACREGGVLLPVKSPATCFLSHAHGVKDIEQVLTVMETVLKKMQREDEA